MATHLRMAQVLGLLRHFGSGYWFEYAIWEAPWTWGSHSQWKVHLLIAGASCWAGRWYCVSKPHEHEALSFDEKSTYWEQASHWAGCCKKANIVMASPVNMRLSFSMMGGYAEITNALFTRNVEPLGGTKESNLNCESHHWCGKIFA